MDYRKRSTVREVDRSLDSMDSIDSMDYPGAIDSSMVRYFGDSMSRKMFGNSGVPCQLPAANCQPRFTPPASCPLPIRQVDGLAVREFSCPPPSARCPPSPNPHPPTPALAVFRLTPFHRWHKKGLEAGVVKLVDARDSKSRGACPMRVRFPPPAPQNTSMLIPRITIFVQSRFTNCRRYSS